MQENVDGSKFWINLSDDATYIGINTYTFTISTNIGLENNQYKCLAINTSGDVESKVAILTFDTEPPETLILEDLTDDCSVTAIPPTTTDNSAGTVTGTTTDPLCFTAKKIFSNFF